MSRDIPRDPISGQRAIHEGDRRDVSEMSSREIEEEITHTRAHMSSTLNAIEARVSPARLKYEVKSTIDEAVDKFNPQRLAKKAGDNMLETIKDHPVPAIIAGLSIGYMFMKGSDDDSSERRYSELDYRRIPYSRARGQSMYRDDVYPSRHPEYPARYPERDSSRTDEMREKAEAGMSDVRERAGEAASDVRDYAGEKMHDAKEAMSDAGHRARDMGRSARRSARRAEHRVEHFVHDNPLLAGLVAAGAGALLGSLLPSTRFEDEQIGPYRDDLVDQASDMADEARERAGHVAEDAKQELKESGERIVESAQSEAKEMQRSHDGNQAGRGIPAEARSPERGPTR